MLAKIKYYISKKTFKNILFVFSENIVSKLISFLLLVLIARTLGPDKFGMYSLVTVSIMFLVTFLDFGLENVVVRFSGKYEAKKEEIFGAYCSFKIIIGALFCLIIFLFTDILPKFLNKPGSEKYIPVILVGFLCEALFFFITTYLQSIERFFTRAAVTIGVFSLKLIAIFVLLKLFSISDVGFISWFFALGSLPFIVLFLKRILAFFRSFLSLGIDRYVIREMLHYSKWIIIGALPVKLMMRLDFYMVSSFSSFREIGIYNSAVQLVSAFSFIPLVFATVFLPKLSKQKDVSQMKLFVKRIAIIGVPATLLIMTVIPFSKYFISFVLGARYLEAFPIFQVLLFAFVFTLWNVMLSTVFYAMGQVKYMALGAYAQLVLFVLAASIFAPSFGIKGIVWSKAFSDMSYLGIVIYFLHKILTSPDHNKVGHRGVIL